MTPDGAKKGNKVEVMELKDYRELIDKADDELMRGFIARMEVSAQLSAYKKAHGLQVYDPARERAKLLETESKAPEELREYVASLYSLLFELSRSYQNRLAAGPMELSEQISAAVRDTQPLFPERATVACQGVEGAYSQIACSRLFRRPDILYFPTFDAVFTAIEEGRCPYGVIPVENSTAGTVNAVYDLMMQHDFRIVRSIRLKVEHNLLVKPGTKLEDIREIYSHEQAINQCGAFLQTLTDVKVIPCANTAMAAKMVAESGRSDVAALSSHACMKLYGLACLKEAVQNQDNNFTRFICISKKLEIFPGADRTSFMAVLPHEPGSLYKLLSRFYAQGVNLNKLESRPMPNRNFEFMFYFDLESSVYSPRFLQLMGELPTLCEKFSYLGSYSEIV